MLAPETLTISDMLAGMRRADFSSEELTRACLERIDRLEPGLHTLITRTSELALQMAQAADRRYTEWRRDDPSATWNLPALLGVPIMVKDVLCLKDVRCTCGSRILEDFIPPYTATAVQRLLDAGVVVVGKTNTDEFAMGSSTENSAYGPTHNPWDACARPGRLQRRQRQRRGRRPGPRRHRQRHRRQHPPARLFLRRHRAETHLWARLALWAGGLRLFVGCRRGLRPQRRRSGHALSPDGRPRPARTPPAPTCPCRTSASILAPCRACASACRRNTSSRASSPQVEQAVRAAIRQMEELGARIQPIHLAHTSYALPVYYLIAPAEASANLARYDGVRYGLREPASQMWDIFFKSRGKGFGAEVKRRIMLGTYALSAGYYDAYYGQAQKVRTLIRQDFDQAFTAVDVIACPVAPTTAFKIGEHGDDPLAMYLEDVFTLPANLAGVPGLAFPVGFDPAGLPVGMQLIGPHFKEDVLLRAAHAYQQATDWHLRQPVLDDRAATHKFQFFG